MKMLYRHVGANGKKRRYYIETDSSQPVAWFDDLDTAAVVLRYLNGDDKEKWEREAAHVALKAFDKEGDKENDT